MAENEKGSDPPEALGQTPFANASGFSLRTDVSRVLVVLVGCDQVTCASGITLNANELSVIRAVHGQYDPVGTRTDLVTAAATEAAPKATAKAASFLLWGLLGRRRPLLGRKLTRLRSRPGSRSSTDRRWGSAA